jgi:hypothetical protein
MTWEQRIAEFKERMSRKRELLRQKNEEERQHFEAECQSPEFLQKFTKPSSQLFQLWRLQKSLALQHNFEEAKTVKQHAEELQKQETNEAQKRAMHSVQQHYEKLLLKQKKELQCLEANDLRKLKQMECEMKKEKEAVQKLNKQVESRMRDKRVPLKRMILRSNSRETTAPFLKRESRTKSCLDRSSTALEVRMPDLRAVLRGRGK